MQTHIHRQGLIDLMPGPWSWSTVGRIGSSTRRPLRRAQSSLQLSASLQLHSSTVAVQAQQQQERPYRDEIIDSYEADLRAAGRWAYIIGFLHNASRFLAFCNLTWATVAILGAFLTTLHPRDFALVTGLLFLEAGRLASATFFLRVVIHPLDKRSQNPERIRHSEDEHYPTSFRVRFSSEIVQILLIGPGIVVPIIGHLLLTHSYSPPVHNLKNSLRIFYSFVAVNSFVALVRLICSARAFKALYKPPEKSILRYFDTVLEKIISSGLAQADSFEVFGFAYTMLGGEFSRNVQPEAVAKNHKTLIQYLRAHRLGLDALGVYLEAHDPFLQLAAVNMVGFWSDRIWGVGLPDKELRKLPQELLTKLADKVGTGQLGWAATNSFAVLAQTPDGARMVARTRNSSGEGLPDYLVELVEESTSRSLALVRALVGFYEQCCVNETEPPQVFKDRRRLVAKLERLAEKAGVHRLRVYAAYFLLLMGSPCSRKVILEINPTRDSFWFTTELSMLKLLRSHFLAAPPLHLPAEDSAKPFSRVGPPITVPPWAEPIIPYPHYVHP